MLPARLNPFRSDVLDNLDYLCRSEELQSWLTTLEQNSWCGEILGAHGSGKTTLLSAVQRILTARGIKNTRLFFNEAHPPPRWRLVNELPAQKLLLVDGAEQLTSWQWRALRRKATTSCGLIVTAHRSLGMPCAFYCHPTPNLLHDLCRNILGAPEITPLDATQLFTRHRGNIRDALRELYDRYSFFPRAVATDTPSYTAHV